MAVFQLPEDPVFPPVKEADEDGLLAIGGDFSPERLLTAYASGIFPWFTEHNTIFWFSPDPRLVLFPEHFTISGSLKRISRSSRFTVMVDHDFEGVILQCATAKRKHEEGTWISSDFIEGYTHLHHLGYAHSVETYYDEELVGGLYGVSLGKAFFGESMFYKQPNASMIALLHLHALIVEWGFHFIDCQVETSHFMKHGATLLARDQFLKRLSKALDYPTKRGNWGL